MCETDGIFDTMDTSWLCHGCGERWYSSDGWAEIGKLVIPNR